MAKTPNKKVGVDIPVGHGPVTISGILGVAVLGLTSLASFATTLSGNLPAGISPTVGVVLGAVAAGASAVALAIVALGRTAFAKLKVEHLNNWQWLDDYTEDPPAEPTDTVVDPPVVPADDVPTN